MDGAKDARKGDCSRREVSRIERKHAPETSAVKDPANPYTQKLARKSTRKRGLERDQRSVPRRRQFQLRFAAHRDQTTSKPDQESPPQTPRETVTC